jgi:probable F420-dependent oxidoreductase
MKIGVNLINFGPSANPENLRRWATLSEDLGYHMLMTSDHVAMTPDVQARYPAPLYEPLSTLGWLAGVTRKIAIGSTVIILPYRNPLEVARAFANIDQLSGGRCILGVGVGWAEQEFATLKVPFHKRGAISSEYLAVIKQAWTEEKSSFDGEFIQFSNVHNAPLPAQKPHPPIWVGGKSPGALRRAVQYGDGWHPLRMTVKWLRDTGIPQLLEMADREGKKAPEICPRLTLRLTDTDLDEDDRTAGEGSLDQIRGDMSGLEELGCSHVVLDTFTGDVEATANPEHAWRMYETLAEKIFDLGREAVR